MSEFEITTVKIVFAILQLSLFIKVLTSFEYLRNTSISYVVIFITLITLINIFMFPVYNLQFNTLLYFILIWIPIVLVFLIVAKYKDGRFLFSLVMADSAVLITFGFEHWFIKLLDNPYLVHFLHLLVVFAIFFIIRGVYRPKLMIAQDTLKDNWLIMCYRPAMQNIALHIILMNSAEITPLVETIYGFLYILLIIQFFVTLRSFGNFVEFTQLKKENAQLVQQFNTRLEDNKDLLKKEDALKLIRHDLRHHLTHLFLLIDNDDKQQALEYIEQFHLDISTTQRAQYCENIIINSLVANYVNKALKHHIKVTTLIHLPNDISTNEIDLSVILSNAFENAINANLKIEDVLLRDIHIRCKTTNKDIQIKIQNPNHIPVDFEDGLPVSRVPDHGFGTKSMRMLAKRFDGTVEFDQSNGQFTCVIYLMNKKART